MNKQERFWAYGQRLEMIKDELPNQDYISQLMLLTELEDMMNDDIVHFTYIKRDGTVRNAYGTRALDIIETRCPEKPSKKEHFNATTFPYFDLEKEDWRCFCIETLREINHNYTL